MAYHAHERLKTPPDVTPSRTPFPATAGVPIPIPRRERPRHQPATGGRTMTPRIGTLFLLAAWCPSARAQPDAPAKPFVPQPILPGGVVLSLYPADSPRLKK